jgi:hypothetical protein
MTGEIVLNHEFVEFVPDELEERTIYISIRFATATHLCCCGCRGKVVTPLRPTDWKLIFDGKTVSLDPSIGNWSFNCRSHYWITQNKVQWAPTWSKERIEAGRIQDRRRKQRYFQQMEAKDVAAAAKEKAEEPVAATKGLWQKLKSLWSR